MTISFESPVQKAYYYRYSTVRCLNFSKVLSPSSVSTGIDTGRSGFRGRAQAHGGYGVPEVVQPYIYIREKTIETRAVVNPD
jgi:hypothetical protein